MRSRNVLAAAMLIGGALLVNTAFALLGAVFDYPDVLGYRPEEVLGGFHADRVRIAALFGMLALGAALLAPIALLTARLAGGGRLPRAAAVAGVAAAVVQVLGLLRWPLLMPGLAAGFADPGASATDRADIVRRFETVHTVLGQVVGETLGYLLTAAWTVMIAVALHRGSVIGRWSAGLALVSVPLILAGLLVPFGVPGADQANFAGYVIWSLWLVILGIGLVRAEHPWAGLRRPAMGGMRVTIRKAY